jgi:purine-binding chemotaxis protein CheW
MMSESGQFDKRVVEILEAVEQYEETVKHRGTIIEIEENNVQLMVFMLEEKYYAFAGDVIKEIVPMTEITYVPGMPAYLLGVINVRGAIESVLDLRKALGFNSSKIGKRNRIAIGHVGDMRSGLLVDSVEDVLEIPRETIHAPVSSLDSSRAAYVAGESTYHGQTLMLLDLGKIFEELLQ